VTADTLDVNGDGLMDYQYDGLGRLSSARQGTATPTAFGYDGIGNMRSGNGTAYNYTSGSRRRRPAKVGR
jgi:YD repeat-containing protein